MVDGCIGVTFAEHDLSRHIGIADAVVECVLVQHKVRPPGWRELHVHLIDASCYAVGVGPPDPVILTKAIGVRNGVENENVIHVPSRLLGSSVLYMPLPDRSI